MLRSRFLPAFYVVLVFLSGAVAGAVGSRLYYVSTVQSGKKEGPPRLSPEEYRKRYTDELKSRLRLNDDQFGKLQVILDETRSQFHDARQRSDAEMKQIHEGQVARIKAILDEKQQADYEVWRIERQKRREQMKKDGPPPPSR